MIKKEVKEVLVKKEVDLEITCNRCGYTEESYEYGNFAFQDIHLTFGYGSKFDTENWYFHVCETCLMEWISTFKFAPHGFSNDVSSSGWITDQEIFQEQFEVWKKKH